MLYLLSGIAIVSAMKKGADAKASSLLRWPVLLGLVLHGYALQSEMFQPEAVHFGFGYAVSVMFFLSVIILFVESCIHRLHGQFRRPTGLGSSAGTCSRRSPRTASWRSRSCMPS